MGGLIEIGKVLKLEIIINIFFNEFNFQKYSKTVQRVEKELNMKYIKGI